MGLSAQSLLACAPPRLFECFSFCIINCIFHASDSPCCSGFSSAAAARAAPTAPAPASALAPPSAAPTPFAPASLSALAPDSTHAPTPPPAATPLPLPFPPPPPRFARHARICKRIAFQLQFVFTTCLALCSFYGICWCCFALISFHCPRPSALTPLVTLCPSKVGRAVGRAEGGRTRDTKAVNLCTRQTNKPNSFCYGFFAAFLALLFLLLFFLHLLHLFSSSFTAVSACTR